MLQITPQMKVLVAVAPVDFRKGIDGLAAVCKTSLQQDPFAGTVFVFRNRRATAIKVLVYDGQGFWLCQKRLSESRFRWWPSSDDHATTAVAAHELTVLFSAGNPNRTSAAPQWRSVTPKT
jgi:transposase